jgi:FkbM family methyltransferase
MPSRILGRLARATLGVTDRPSLAAKLARPSGRWDMVRLGGECGWWIPRAAADNPGVAYCAGAGEDITFELELHRRGHRVVTIDPTPRAIAHVQRVAPDDERFRLVPLGCWDEETDLRFFAPANPAFVSHSALNLDGTSSYFEAHVVPLGQLARELGDERVDLVKLDIEGAEYRVLRSLLVDGPRPDVLCVEFDHRQPIPKTLWYVLRLRRAGYALAHLDCWNYTFVRERERAR